MIRRWLPLIAMALIGVVIVSGIGLMMANRNPATVTSTIDPSVKIGGPFSLTDQSGKTITDAALRGKPTAIFFGFTFCPDVCPTTLTHLTALMDQLGPDADKLNVVLISVDPERDTPEALRRYLANFDSRIIGLTGSVDQIAAVTKAYRVYYKKVPQGDDYTVDHSSAVYLFDAQGQLVSLMAFNEPLDRSLKSLKALIAAS